VNPRLADDTLGGMNRRPRLSIIAPGASPEEAAAVVAAIEQFMRATAPPLAEPAPPPSGWLQAALHEGVLRVPRPPLPWE
jgi:hypothetical protein